VCPRVNQRNVIAAAEPEAVKSSVHDVPNRRRYPGTLVIAGPVPDDPATRQVSLPRILLGDRQMHWLKRKQDHTVSTEREALQVGDHLGLSQRLGNALVADVED